MEEIGYNVKITRYHSSIEYTFYDKPIKRGKKKEEIKEVEEEKKEEEKEKDKLHSEYESIRRTKNMLANIVRANDWHLFLTMTFAPDKVDRFDLNECKKKLTHYFNNMKKRKDSSIYYVAVPEQHKNRAWHFHILVGADDKESLFKTMELELFKNDIYNVNSWKWGFTTATVVSDTRRVSTYIMKYINKDLCTIEGAKRYYASKNCKRGQDEYMWADDLHLAEIKVSLIEQASYFKSVSVPQIAQEITYINVDV